VIYFLIWTTFVVYESGKALRSTSSRRAVGSILPISFASKRDGTRTPRSERSTESPRRSESGSSSSGKRRRRRRKRRALFASNDAADHWAGGRYAFGYRSAAAENSRRRVLVIFEPEATIVRSMFAWSAAGWSLRQIATELERLGVKRPHGGRRWHRSAVHAILTNPGYMGQGRYNLDDVPGKVEREARPNRCGRRHRPECSCAKVRRRTGAGDGDNVVFSVAYPVIVEPELWTRVTARLDENKGTRALQTSDPERFLRSYLACGSCGRRLRAKAIRRKNVRGEVVKVHSYYVCEYRDPETAAGCRRISEAAIETERIAWTVLSRLYTDRVWLRQHIREYELQAAVTDVERGSAVDHAREVLAAADKDVRKWLRIIERVAADESDREILDHYQEAKARRMAAAEALAEAEARVVRAPSLTDAEIDAEADRVSALVLAVADPEGNPAALKAAVLSELRIRITVPVDDDAPLLFESARMGDFFPAGIPQEAFEVPVAGVLQTVSGSVDSPRQTDRAGNGSVRLAVRRELTLETVPSSRRNPAPAGRAAP
jgi:Recombinase